MKIENTVIEPLIFGEVRGFTFVTTPTARGGPAPASVLIRARSGVRGYSRGGVKF